MNYTRKLATYTKGALRPIISSATKWWHPYSRLILAHDTVWTNYWDYVELKNIFHHLKLRVYGNIFEMGVKEQSIFYLSRWSFFKNLETLSNNRLATAYYHGLPGTGVEEFDILYHKLVQNHHKISQIQVTHSEMENVILESGISPDKVYRIPIGINLDYFNIQTDGEKYMVRQELKLPQGAFIIGTFHKDGIGWRNGLEPKLIKGPDIFLSAIKILKEEIPELFVMLTGPARGYVINGLVKMKIPYKHFYVKNSIDIGKYYHALDAYIIPSRQEGGPKALLESMASGIALISTRVGQAMDIISHQDNGWMVDVEDAEGLAHYTKLVYENNLDFTNLKISARKTAEENSYMSQIPLWKEFTTGFVQHG